MSRIVATVAVLFLFVGCGSARSVEQPTGPETKDHSAIVELETASHVNSHAAEATSHTP
ncbi:MAG: hypothetical protein QM817_03200 [Archangium sp.]